MIRINSEASGKGLSLPRDYPFSFAHSLLGNPGFFLDTTPHVFESFVLHGQCRIACCGLRSVVELVMDQPDRVAFVSLGASLTVVWNALILTSSQEKVSSVMSTGPHVLNRCTRSPAIISSLIVIH